MRFILEHKNSKSILFHVVSLFGMGKVSGVEKATNTNQMIIRSMKSIKVVYHYFTHFQLKTIKKTSFQK